MDAKTQTGGKHKGRAGVSVVSALGFGRWALGITTEMAKMETARGRTGGVGQNAGGG